MTARRARRLPEIVATAAAPVDCRMWRLAASGGDRLPPNEARPKSLDPRLTIELFAEAPQIVTPTDLAVDHLGRVWAIESNTHFPPGRIQGAFERSDPRLHAEGR